MEATEFVRVLQKRQGQLIASPEEIAFASGWIDGARLADQGRRWNNDYGRALLELAADDGRERP